MSLHMQNKQFVTVKYLSVLYMSCPILINHSILNPGWLFYYLHNINWWLCSLDQIL